MAGEAHLDRALAAFRQALRFPFREDAALADDLSAEARPVIDALAFAIAAAPRDPLAIEHREALAMCTLLGRRAALQRATPSVAVGLVDAIEAALAAIDRRPQPVIVVAVRAVILEGYCAAIEERVAADGASAAARSLAPQRLAPHCWLLIVAGDHAAETLARALDRAGRTLLDGDCRACLLHSMLTVEPAEDLAAAIFGFDATARLVGAQCVFSGLGDRWLALARDPHQLLVEPRFEDALRRALALVGAEIREASPIVTRLRRLLDPSA